jgi:hypothetical protein
MQSHWDWERRAHALFSTSWAAAGSPKLRFEAQSGTIGFCFRVLPVPHVRSSSSPLANRFVRTIAKPALSGKKELPHPPLFQRFLGP